MHFASMGAFQAQRQNGPLFWHPDRIRRDRGTKSKTIPAHHLVNRLLTVSASELGSTFLQKTSACYAILECITEEVRGSPAPPPFAIT
jgi:hypothetical protein